MLAYNNAMAGDFDVDEELMDVYAEGLTQARTMLRDFFGVPDENFLDWKRDSSAQPLIGMFVPEYPELEGGDELHVLTVSDSVCNSALWKVYRNKVLSMSDSIDVWYNSPASSLFQDPVSKAVIGVEVDRNGDVVNVRAKKFSEPCVCLGYFENWVLRWRGLAGTLIRWSTFAPRSFRSLAYAWDISKIGYCAGEVWRVHLYGC